MPSGDAVGSAAIGENHTRARIFSDRLRHIYTDRLRHVYIRLVFSK
jgi:hypothetical protein